MRGKFLLIMILCLYARIIDAADLRGDTIDIHSYQLSIDLRDFDTHILYGEATIDIRSLQEGVSHIDLDLLRLTVDSIRVNESAVSYAYDDSVLRVRFPKNLDKDEVARLSVFYHGKPGVAPGDFGGFYWDNQYAFNIGVSFVSCPHSYGRNWFPCFDDFKVRSLYEFFITTRKTEKAFCNGILQDVKADSSSTVWHWKLKETIPAYLASVAVADYQTLHDTVHGINGIIPIEIAALAEDTAIVKKRFMHLHESFNILERDWGPYRWERVGYCIVPFQEGAMEHATNIAFMQNYLYGLGKECEVTMTHELSHHWFGNLVTCETEADMWLNEGWATYSQSLFIEGLYGADSARQYRSAGHLNELLASHVSDNGYLPLGSIPSKYTYGSTVYQKGGDVIQTLRYYLGDSVFFHCMKAYLSQYAFNTANTGQLSAFLSECSGTDLSSFFDDWVLAPGYPHFSISKQYFHKVQTGYEVLVHVRQRLSHTPQFYNQVPVAISYFDGAMNRKDLWFWINGENSVCGATLSFKPTFVAIDFDENLAQATSRESHIIRDTGVYEFGNAMMSVEVESISDPSLISCVQNLLPADPMLAYSGLHLNHNRYWTVDGVFNSSMRASGIFEYSASPEEHLDAGFITNEDSLVMMYRPDQETDWQRANSFSVEKGSSDSDMTGVILVSPLKKGEYAIAQYRADLPVEQRNSDNVFRLKSTIKRGFDFKMQFDIQKEVLKLEFRKSVFEKMEILDEAGKALMVQNITSEQNKLSVGLSPFTNAGYIVTLTSKSGKRISKKLNKL